MVWQKHNKELDPKNLKGTVKHAGSKYMELGCTLALVVEEWVFIDGILIRSAIRKFYGL